MPVISFVSPKGGVGKSTSALLLATELAHKGLGVTVIDGDPEQWIYRWAERGNVPATMHVVSQPSEETIIDAIESAAAETPFVIVDLEGTANMVVAYAISRSDLVVIPTQASTMDGQSAAKAIKLVKQQERGFSRRIPFAVLFTRTSAAIKSRLERDLETQMLNSNVPVFQTQLLERSAYRSIFDYACPLEQLPKSVSNLDNAITNARAFTGEVLAMCKSSHAEQPSNAAKSEEVAA